ncbi:MAG: hypothetical protein ACYCTV_03465 [Leptospirales bacterium]
MKRTIAFMAFMLGVFLVTIQPLPIPAASPILVAPDGTYLGNLNNNPYDPNSVSNPYGIHGSPYSPDSINNPYSPYGSPYSPQSPNDPYGQGPAIVSPGTGNGEYGNLSK